MRILVTGVRGKTGAPLAASLGSAPGVEVLGGSSSPERVDVAGGQSVSFSWDEPATWAEVCRDVDAVYLVRPDRADAPELIAALLERTDRSTRVVLLSERAADDVGADGWALRAEHAVRASGHRWTILRPSWFMQVFTDPRFYRDDLLEGGELQFASGGGSIAWIDARDIAAVARQALLEDVHVGEIYELSGPESLSLPQTVELLSRGLGRPVSLREVSIEEAVAGSAGFERDLFALTFERVRAGVFGPVTDTVERVTGRAPRGLETFLSDVGPTLASAPERGERT